MQDFSTRGDRNRFYLVGTIKCVSELYMLSDAEFRKCSDELYGVDVLLDNDDYYDALRNVLRGYEDY